MPHELSVLAEGFRFTEGPRLRDGELWFSGFGSRLVQSVTEERVTRRAFVLGQLSGIAFGPDGRVLVGSTVNRRVVSFMPGERPDLVAETWPVYTGALNDMVVDRRGRDPVARGQLQLCRRHVRSGGIRELFHRGRRVLLG